MRRSGNFESKSMILRVGVLLLIGLFAGIPAGFADSAFDKSRVQPPACRAPAYGCGFQPPAADDLAAVPLAENLLHGGGTDSLPARVDLRSQMPPVGDQGPHASGVAWALAYGLMSHGRARLDALAELAPAFEAVVDPAVNPLAKIRGPGRGGAADRPCMADAVDAARLYSPAHLYNALNGGQDRGIDLLRAGRHLVREGTLDCAAAPYDPAAFRVRAERPAKNAGYFRARGMQRLDPLRRREIEARLARGQSVAVGLSIYDNFYTLGRGVYEVPSAAARRGGFRGGHAVVLVGYDRNKKTAGGASGAFLFQNSFSRDWGDRGFGWISYRAFRQLVRTAVILDFGDSEFTVSDSLAVRGEPGLPGENLLTPGIPLEIVASRGQYADRIVVQFSPAPGAYAYEIWRAWPRSLSENREQPFALVGYARGTRFVDRVVQAGVAFRYRVRAIGQSAISSPSVIAEGFAAPRSAGGLSPPVIGLRAFAGLRSGRARVELRWMPAGGARAYRVMRFESKRNRWRLLSRSQTGTSYIDRRPATGDWNIYRVQAINDVGRSPWSASARAFVGDDQRPPAPVNRLRASQGRFADRIEVQWDAVAGADRYRVYRYERSGDGRGEWRGPFDVSTTGYVDSIPDAGSTAGAYVAYRVAAGNARGFSNPGSPAFGFAGSDADQGGLAAIRGLRLRSVSGASVELEWPATRGAKEYYILRKRAGETDFGFIGNIVAPGGDSAAPLNYREAFPGESAAGEVFLYTVRAADAGGRESADSNIVAAFAQPERRPIRKRFFWSSGGAGEPAGRRFAGVWTAMDWDGESGPRRIEMRISQSGPRFEGEYRIGNNPSRKFEGEYVYGSRVLETRGFRMELLPGPAAVRPGLAAESIVRIDSGDLSPYDVELAFERTAL